MSVTLCRGRIWQGNYPGHLKEDITDEITMQGRLDAMILEDLLEGAMHHYPYGAMAYHIAQWLAENFEIRMKR